MFHVTRKVTGTRSKADVPAGIIVSCTKGIIRVTSQLAALMRLQPQDRVMIVFASVDEDGPEAPYIAKMPLTKNPEDQQGSLISAIGKNGATLQFSDNASWKELQGNEDVNALFAADLEGVQEQTDEVTNSVVKYYPLAFHSKKAKAERKGEGEGEEEEGDDD